MNFRNILLISLGVIIIIFNIIYGNAISWFLSVCISGSIVYFLFQMYLERNLLQQVRKAGGENLVLQKAGSMAKRYRAMFSFILMTAVFISSIICIRNVAMPREDKPYFYNNEYHAISNTGILFQKLLPLYSRSDIEDGGKIIFEKNTNGVNIYTQEYYRPIMVAEGENSHYSLLNKVYDKEITNQFGWKNLHSSVSIEIEDKSNFVKKLLGRNALQLYRIHIKSDQSELFGEGSGKVDETFTFTAPKLKKGMSLYNLMFEQNIEFPPSPAAMQVLQEMMQEFGNSFLLAHEKGESGYYFFPEKTFIDNGYELIVNNEIITPKISGKYTIPLETLFYIGFNNAKEKIKIENGGNDGLLLSFDHPNNYWLSVPNESQVLNTKSMAFLTNDFDLVIDGKGKQGYYFNNFGLITDANFDGRLHYIIGKPTDPLQYSIHDLKSNQEVPGQGLKFNLNSDKGDVKFVFQIRDFSDNGFSFAKMLLYAGIVYLGMLFVLIFFPGKDLGRIEAIIFTVIYALFIVRMIMYWRIATFPPLENISKYELENTIINFDFNLFGNLPFPLTIVWIYLFLLFLIIYRKFQERILNGWNQFINSWMFNRNRSIVHTYGIVMLSMLILNLINSKILGIEILSRILAIILPLTLYIIFSILSNRTYTLNEKWVHRNENVAIKELKAYFYYFINSPSFFISFITLGYFALSDRGFAVLFILFLILKTILLSFLKKSYNSNEYSLWKMLVKPNNFWIYGIMAMIVYFVLLSVKSLFYYALLHYLWIIGVVLGIVFLVIFLFYKDKKWWLKSSGLALVLFLIIVSIPYTRNGFDKIVSEELKHVQYRVSILNQPISDLLMENEYTSFSTRKIIETAENQWFINSYISKEYNNDHTINFRPYNRVGVNYNTQTRDVVLARFVIGEMGNITMYLLLTLCVFPLLVYLMSFKFTQDDGFYYKVNEKTYPGIIPLLLFFTICLFVWLTSTNRFVFFGQDFPFLSLTSKISVILPLILFGITLVQRPKAKSSEKINLQSGFAKYILFIGLVVFFALITVNPNTLNSKNFSVIVENTQNKIDQELNAILSTIQDSISVQNPKFSYSDMIAAMKSDESFRTFLNESIQDPYTESIVKELVNKPYKAFQVNSPLYIQYDGYRYSALYNQHFYLELPPVENEQVWHGTIAQNSENADNSISLMYDNESSDIKLPSLKTDPVNGIQMAFVPQTWLVNSTNNIALINVLKKGGENAKISIFKDVKNTFEQRSDNFVTSVNSQDLLAIEHGGKRFTVQFEDRGNIYALNKWINGKYRILYPLRPKNMWIHHFAHSIKSIFNEQDAYRERYNVSLDFNLNKKIENLLHTRLKANKKDNRFKFAVISADGDGQIHLMQDFVSNRKDIDPNDNYTINKLKQQQFFYSNIRNERDQWGEANLVNMMLGPGSSIKPLIAGIVSSQANAGWENLTLNGVAGDQSFYAGFKLIKPWIKEVQDGGSFDLVNYISKSSNFYQSLYMFLGSYPRSAFEKEGKISLENVLVSQGGSNNNFPSLTFNGMLRYLPNYEKGSNNWPKSNYQEEKRSFYFGNENSLLANGLEVNANLITKEKNKDQQYSGAYDRINMIDSASYKLLQQLGNSNYLWSMPEESSFLQRLRSPNEIHQNVNIGLKTATLGGYPYQVSNFKMLEMFGSLFTQNRGFRLHIDPRKLDYIPWYVDSSWNSNKKFNQFMASNIFKGMSEVVTNGTARNLNRPNPNYYYYAKTGTINEQGSQVKSSKRLVVVIADKDLTNSDNIGNSKIYLLYFMADRTGNIDWSLVNQIVGDCMNSNSFKNYFQNIN